MNRNYKERIYNFLKKTKEPTDVEQIRITCKIGNWNTALKHCLELMFDGKINGQRTSRGWIFWAKKEDT